MKFVQCLFLCSAMLVSCAVLAQDSLPQLGKAPITEVIKAMTLEEKASLVAGAEWRFKKPGPTTPNADGSLPFAAGNAMNIASRLGIPGILLSDGTNLPDINDTSHATVFPGGSLLASSWDTGLIRKVGNAFGNETREYGADVALTPVMNVRRNPLNEQHPGCFSEDPFLSGWIATAMVKGIQSNGVGAAIRYFATNGQDSAGRSIVMSERAFREIYLQGFQIAVKHGQPWTVITSNDKLNGTVTSQRKEIMADILRSEWGFQGIVMSRGSQESVTQINAGSDVFEPGGGTRQQEIINAVNEGSLDVKVLDASAERILNMVVKTPAFKQYKYSNHPDLKAHAAIIRAAAAESMVLLKNAGNTLPLKQDSKLAVFADVSYQNIAGGVNIQAVSIADGLSKAGYKINGQLSKKYLNGIQQHESNAPSSDMIDHVADDADVAVFTIGRDDRKMPGDFNLPDTEKVLIKTIADAFHAKGKKLVIVMKIDDVIETASWRENADAILLAWQPGSEAGNSIADVLSGAVNPSGKLAVTFPVNYEDEPTVKGSADTASNTDTEIKYKEGIYTGYRYFKTVNVKPAYEFGYGLSYSKFLYSNLRLSSSRFTNNITATLSLTNQGKSAGKEIVQVYLAAPSKNIDKPALELKGFVKTKMLKPGETQIIKFTLTAKDLASFYEDKQAWIADAGRYAVKAAASSADTRLTADFKLLHEIVVEKVHPLSLPKTQ